MKKLWATLAAVLSLFVAVEVVEMAPASADSICHVSVPQVDNTYFCARTWLVKTSGSWGNYKVHYSAQITSVAWVGEPQVKTNAGLWLRLRTTQIPYDAFGSGRVDSWGGLINKPLQTRMKLTNVYTGAVLYYTITTF